jgi:hypothetical protein
MKGEVKISFKKMREAEKISFKKWEKWKKIRGDKNKVLKMREMEENKGEIKITF